VQRTFLNADNAVKERLTAMLAQLIERAPAAFSQHGPARTFIMRIRIILAALLAGTLITPAIAQDQEGRRGERLERGDVSRGTIQDRGNMGPPRQRFERPQEQPQVQHQVQVRESPTLPNRSWRGDWQRRTDEVSAARAQTPPVVQQVPTEQNRGWRGNNGGGWNRGEQRTPPVVTENNNWRRGDRDGDGRPNWRDRDRDGDGVRNNRDWDRNNNGRVDGRWDRNRNGVVDRRWDQNRDGVRDNRNWNNDRRWNNGQNWSNNYQRWNRDWRNDRRYDWQRYRYSNRDLYRQPRYYSPYGYGYSYQRFGIGIYLESILFGSRYRISNPWQYRLPDAQWPYEWVRYYDDVLLVDTRNGYVVDVIYDFFW
jgi:Nickel/cobalt transporter regulator